ncbi:MAG: mannanase [Gammaproteobacteria bacterium]|nr:MAG: mannanase [Gammaproteobacteria bacterium]
MNKLISICIAALLMSAINLSLAAEKAATNKVDFFTTDGIHLSLNGKPYYVVGSNMWYGGYLGSGGAVGDRARLLKELDNLKAIGINNLRVLAVSEKSELNSAVHPATTNGFGQHDEELLAGLDFLLAEMAKRDMSIVIYLNNFWQWSGGMTQYMSWIDGKPVQDPNVTNDWEGFMEKSASFYQSKKAQTEWRKTIKKIVTRVNTITGKSYINDPTILSWQLANEPRPGNSKASEKEKSIYVKWINETAKYIHELDSNHMVSTGSEGLMGSTNDEKLFIDAHASPYINYLTYHMWVRNWSWYDQKNPEKTWDVALQRGTHYLHHHIDIARKMNKPIVLEEFGLDRDMGAYDTKSTTHYRDKFYRIVFDTLYNRAKNGDAIAGYNFWAWNGEARTIRENFWWKTGDDFMGDPPQEQQGMYGVFDSDISTILIIKEYAEKMHALK